MSEHTDVSTWTVAVTANNASAVATRTAHARKAHYVTGLYASFSTSNLKLLTLADGTTTLSFYVYDHAEITFPKPVRLEQGAAATATLAASGTGGQIGALVMTGFTIGA